KITLYDEDLWSLFDNDTENNTYNNSCCEDMGDVCTQGVGLGFQRLFLPALYSVALVLGVLGNGLVIAVLCQFRRGWSVTDTFILNLALADTLLVVTLPFWAALTLRNGFWRADTNLSRIRRTQQVLKRNLFFLIFKKGCGGNWVILLLRQATQPLLTRQAHRLTDRCTQLLKPLLWLCALWMTASNLVTIDSSAPNRHVTLRLETRAFRRLHGHEIARFKYHLPQFCDGIQIIVHLVNGVFFFKKTRQQPAQKQKAIRIILALVVAFFLCWTPYNLTLLADTLHSQSNISDSHGRRTALDISLVATSSLGYLHCCLNPILYAFVGVKFRRNLLELLRALGCPSRAAENKTEEEEGEKNCVVYRAGDEQV
uniref:Chemokine (C-X-C motif) receptor 3, tandem duplicate 1 n=1 Tax=Lepisosteus oculatus TaxID=7918 RepID=W5MAJ1_LEPOC